MKKRVHGNERKNLPWDFRKCPGSLYFPLLFSLYGHKLLQNLEPRSQEKKAAMFLLLSVLDCSSFSMFSWLLHGVFFEQALDMRRFIIGFNQTWITETGSWLIWQCNCKQLVCKPSRESAQAAFHMIWHELYSFYGNEMYMHLWLFPILSILLLLPLTFCSFICNCKYVEYKVTWIWPCTIMNCFL